MDADTLVESVPIGDGNAGGIGEDANNNNIVERISSGGEMMRDIESAGEVLTRIELDLACSSEKLVNLSILMMHVATKESELETFISDEEYILKYPGEKALEFDLLSGVLDSEVNQLDNFMSTLQAEIVDAREIISSYEHLAEALKGMEEMLHDSEESLKQSVEQVKEIKEQSSNFQRILLKFSGEETLKDHRDVELVENGDFSNRNSKIKMQTAEQQRHVLRMLEKSLARELDLEKRVAESREIEEYLKLRLHSSEHEIFCMEDEAVVTWERLFEGENTAQVLMGISKELLGRLQIFQFNLNCSTMPEGELRSKLQDSIEQFEGKDTTLQKFESSNTELNEFLLSQTNTLKASLIEAEDKLVVVEFEVFTLRETLHFLEKQLKEYNFQLMNAKTSGDGNQDLLSQIHEMSSVQDLNKKISKAESRADSAEARCKLLIENNMELNEELNLLKGSGNTSDRVNALQRQLRESEILLQHAVASTEASQEKQSMLDSTIKDMENLIEDLKLKVLKAERLAESAEDKCITLSESNSDLNEELCFLRGRMDCLKVSLHQAEETKKATRKDIRIQTKLITDLVMQLALERERLQKQISSLTKENKILVKQLHQKISSPVNISHNTNREKLHLTTAISTRESKDVTEFSSTATKSDTRPENVSVGLGDTTSQLENVRNIDARQLNIKYVFMAILVLVISVFAASLIQSWILAVWFSP